MQGAGGREEEEADPGDAEQASNEVDAGVDELDANREEAARASADWGSEQS